MDILNKLETFRQLERAQPWWKIIVPGIAYICVVGIVTLFEVILFNIIFPEENSVIFGITVYVTWMLMMVGFFFLRYRNYKRMGLL